jgi:hypothetical protein
VFAADRFAAMSAHRVLDGGETSRDLASRPPPLITVAS